MKIRKVVSGFAAFSMALSLMAGSNFGLEVKAEEKSLADEISELVINPEGDVELIPAGWDEDFNETPAKLLLHGNAVIFTVIGAADSSWTKVYLDVNKNGKIDKSIDTEIDLGSYGLLVFKEVQEWL